MSYMVGIVLWEGVKALTFMLLVIGVVLGCMAALGWLLIAHTIIFFVMLLLSIIIFYGMEATANERRNRRWQKELEERDRNGK